MAFKLSYADREDTFRETACVMVVSGEAELGWTSEHLEQSSYSSVGTATCQPVIRRLASASLRTCRSHFLDMGQPPVMSYQF